MAEKVENEKEKKAAAPEAKAPKAASSKGPKKSYHVAKRPDGKWYVKGVGQERALKLFKTKVEATEYAENLAKNQDAALYVHASKGKSKGKIQ
jgi:hypothetical protein